jgi:hyperosmotically inducible periplasmic protein
MVLAAGCAFPRATGPDGSGGANAAIHAQARAALLSDPMMQAYAVEVLAAGGVVRLQGEVDTDDHRKRAEELVREIEGVREVRNQLAVRKHAPG